VLSSPSTFTSQPDPTTPPTPNHSGGLGGKLPLPHYREGVRTSLRAKGLFPFQSSQVSFPSLQQPVSAPVVTLQSGSTDWSIKLSDLLNGRKESELMTDWEDMGLRLPPTRPGQGNVGRLFVSENVKSDAKRVLGSFGFGDRQGASCVPSHPIKRNVTSRDFIDAFRWDVPRCRPRRVDRIHTSMRREPLSQTRNPTQSTMPGQLILLKHTVPSRITYRLQSETLPRIHSFCEGVFPYHRHCSWLQDLPFSCLGPSALL